jgi:hypothetical protein|tara:strand:+ start:1795 stop:2097 length:303 start_codon:yes stop_codon:yes gene_type:complete
MSNTIKQKRGTSDPSASDLVVGELAINTTDGGVFTKTDGGSVVELGGAATVASGAIYENTQNISANYSITSGFNAMSAGPITIDSGVTVTVTSGSTWTVV